MVKIKRYGYEIIIFEVAILILIISSIGLLSSTKHNSVIGSATAIIYNPDTNKETKSYKTIIYEDPNMVFWITNNDYDHLYYRNKITGDVWLYYMPNPDDIKEVYWLNKIIVSKYCCLGYRHACELELCR